MADNEINTVHVLIRRFLYEIDGILGDKEKCQKWLVSFAKTLQFQDLCKETNEYAVFLLREARDFCATQKRNSQIKQVRKILKEEGISAPTKVQIESRLNELYGSAKPSTDGDTRENGKNGGRPRKNTQDAPHGNAGVDRKSATSCDQITADGDIREDSQAKPDGSAITRNETRAHDALEPSANIYATRQAKNGDAATREGAEDCRNHINVAVDAPTTVSKNMRRVPQNEAPAHGFSGGRTAQGTMSRSPEAAARSGKAYDQETIEISTDEKPTGGHVTGDVLSLAYSGEFGNVRLTQEQYNELGIRFGNLAKLNRAIDSLSCKIENGETNPRNHYAELVKWANYRDDMDEAEEVKAAKQPHYETVSEHNARIVADGKKWIDEHFPKKDNKNG